MLCLLASKTFTELARGQFILVSAMSVVLCGVSLPCFFPQASRWPTQVIWRVPWQKSPCQKCSCQNEIIKEAVCRTALTPLSLFHIFVSVLTLFACIVYSGRLVNTLSGHICPHCTFSIMGLFKKR